MNKEYEIKNELYTDEVKEKIKQAIIGKITGTIEKEVDEFMTRLENQLVTNNQLDIENFYKKVTKSEFEVINKSSHDDLVAIIEKDKSDNYLENEKFIMNIYDESTIPKKEYEFGKGNCPEPFFKGKGITFKINL